MNFLKRAITSIMRRPGKSVILLLLVFILGTVISGAIAVDGAVNTTDANLRRGMRPMVTFQRDWDAYEQFMEEQGYSNEDPNQPQIENLTPEIVHEIGELPYVNYFEYSVPAWLDHVPGFRSYDLWSGEENTSPVTDNEITWLQLRGTSETELLQVRENVVELIEGRMFEESELTTILDVNPIIVSAGFARVNGLALGDIIELPNRIVFEQPEGMWDENWGLNPENIFAEEIFTFEIVGVIDSLESVEELDLNDLSIENQKAMSRLSQVLGTLHITNRVAEDMQRFRDEQRPLMIAHMLESGMDVPIWMETEIEFLENNQNDEANDQLHITSFMLLNDPLEMDVFIEEAVDILPDFWTVEALGGGFDAISSSMETLQGIAFWVLVVSIGATLLILSLLITLFLRDRRYEMGVYLALGEKKGKIISQILLEVVVTAAIGITLAVFTGNMISGVMSRNMLRNELAADQNSDDGAWSWTWSEFDSLGLSTEMSAEEMLDAFDVSLSVGTIGLFYAVGLGAVIFSTIVPVVYVVTLNPKKVLM
jgi:putative ABC transport system permease protein